MCDIKIAWDDITVKKKKIVSGLHAPQNWGTVSPLDRNGQSLQEVFCRLGEIVVSKYDCSNVHVQAGTEQNVRQCIHLHDMTEVK